MVSARQPVPCASQETGETDGEFHMSVTRPHVVLEQEEATPMRPARYAGRLLVTGATGFLGRNLTRAFRSHTLVAAAGGREAPRTEDLAAFTERACFDLRDPHATERWIEAMAPDAVLHLAGHPDLDHCERHPAEAEATNIDATRNLARACRRVGAKVVYLSTDRVFDGETGGYRELSPPGPNTVYGRTKLIGEDIVLSMDARGLVCRTGDVYGAGAPLFAWLSRELAAGRCVDGFQDVVSTPTWAGDLAAFIDLALATDAIGILHTVGPEAVSRYEWFGAFASVFGHDRELVIPAVAGARRRELLLPRNASLDGRATAQTLGHQAHGPRLGFERLRQASAAMGNDNARGTGIPR
jgi:dTDP-4-dehydrorhamnose reductase